MRRVSGRARHGPPALPAWAALARGVIALACALAAAAPAIAVMAGALPDTPAARVDPNVASSPYAGVGAVIVDGAPFSGVLIGRRHVLTAAHVVGAAEPSRIRFRLNAGPQPALFDAAQVIRHPGFVAFATPNVHDDLAIVVLAADVPPEVPVYPLQRAELPVGTTFVAVGYGGSGQGDGSGRVAADPAVKRVGRNAADRYVRDDEGGGAQEVYLFDFDGGGAPNAMGGGTLGNPVETSFASGDSGAPAFVAGSTPPRLFGINTFLSAFAGGPTDPGTFGTGGGGMVVAGYAAWIDATVAATTPASVGAADADAPLPGWLAGVTAAALASVLARTRRHGRAAG